MTESIHFLAGAYVVDALDDVERADFEQHLAGCADCRAEVASLSEGAAVLADAVSTTPPPALRDRVLADIATVRPLPPLEAQDEGAAAPVPVPAPAPVPAPVTRLDSWRRRGVALLVAAAAVVAAVGVGGVWQPWEDDASTQPTAAERVMTAPDAERVSLEFDGGARATVVYSDELGKSVLLTERMPPPPEGKVYQVWYDVPGEGMVSAAVMPVKEDQTVMLEGDASEATGAGITVEPEGGSPEPTSEPIALFAFDEA